jgi:hypothetical protein
MTGTFGILMLKGSHTDMLPVRLRPDGPIISFGPDPMTDRTEARFGKCRADIKSGRQGWKFRGESDDRAGLR